MCMTAPAIVLATFPNEALIQLDGRNRLVSSLAVPELRVGDWVLVGLGTVLSQLSPQEAVRLQALHDAAADASTPPGPPAARAAAADPPAADRHRE